MSEYLEFFRVEAKSLLKNFRDNDKNAIARCAKVFGERTDLSLMNMQHVVAKEFGFANWNELQSAERWQLAAALIADKNKMLKTPLAVDYEEGALYPSSERSVRIRAKLEKRPGLDLVNFTQTSRNGFVDSFLRLNSLDISECDLAKMDVLSVTYDEYTIWPKEADKLPQGFDPAKFIEERKNPGLGVRALHKQGINGANRAVAVIDLSMLTDHIEYHNNLKEHEIIGCAENLHGLNGAVLVSAIAGTNCGVAPKAEVYYFSADNRENGQLSLRYYARALNKICDLHIQLKNDGKSGIDTVCILWDVSREIDGAAEMKAALQRAEELGIWVNSGNYRYSNKLWRAFRIHCKMGGDVENPDDYEVMPNEPKFPESQKDLLRSMLCFPAGGRTVAQADRLDAYQFDAPGFYLNAYVCGLFVLARSICPTLTPDEFYRIGLETGDFRDGIGVIVNPQKLIDALK
ncbi:MAG: hypothetical protein J6A09_02925 [Alphaproteobacteria bacterium]|nr:hypothetical protein [Alphaproteobacteria bacterium]